MVEDIFNIATIILLVVNLLTIVGFFLKIENRITVVETQQRLMLNGLIKTNQLDRRER